MEKKLGRPRSETTKKAILEASYNLLLENGFNNITVDGIANRAGVSKATIYKWWPNKAAVVLDGYFAAAESLLQIPDSGSIQKDLIIQVSNLTTFLTSPKGKMITEFVAEGQYDGNVANEYRTRFFQPRRQISRHILERAVERGELKSNANLELCTDIIYAPIFYRLLITGDPIDEGFIQDLVSYALNGIVVSPCS